MARMLLETEHGGFPVVKYDHETRKEYCYGLLTRYHVFRYFESKTDSDPDLGMGVRPKNGQSDDQGSES